ncbi:sulfotransferase domain-containing protein [Virgibacillus kekensis]|uniref:Sulfotransferase domain-containing protein n=1 Tax=Virgibacillus kekensis TaxID=202261 RepID=A0ABV9DGT8_9BACI
MRKFLRKVYHLPRDIKRYRLNQKYDINLSPIFVLGNQKSGTSAIGALLAEIADKTVTIDLLGIYEPTQSKLHQGQISFKEFVERNKYDFSREVIKEPSLTFLYDEIKSYFNSPKNVFIIRNPYDNIRSILNRVDIPGNVDNISADYKEKWNHANENWKKVIDSRWLGINGENYIEWMSYRWLRCIEIYEQNKDDFILIKYEDFKRDKVNSIKQLAKELNLPIVNDISDKVDIQYQPAGNRSVNKLDFFGERNIERINNICEEKMKEYDYKLL